MNFETDVVRGRERKVRREEVSTVWGKGPSVNVSHDLPITPKIAARSLYVCYVLKGEYKHLLCCARMGAIGQDLGSLSEVRPSRARAPREAGRTEPWMSKLSKRATCSPSLSQA